jgi:hypothetical protein
MCQAGLIAIFSAPIRRFKLAMGGLFWPKCRQTTHWDRWPLSWPWMSLMLQIRRIRRTIVGFHAELSRLGA